MLDGLVRILEEEGHGLGKPARAELRALLAVARAAEFDQRVRVKAFPTLVSAPGSAADRLDRALARLSRVSRGAE